MFIINLLLCLSAGISFLLALVIIVGNPQKNINRSLFLLVINVFLWLLINLLTNLSNEPDVALSFAKLTIVPATLIPYFFYIFTVLFVRKKLKLKNLVLLSILPILIIILSPTSLNLVSIEPNGLNAITGPLYVPLMVQLILYFYLGLKNLYKDYKSISENNVRRKQIKYVFIGVLLSFIPIFIFNAVAPVLFANDTVILLGPNAIVFLAAFMTLAIVKHGLLDIRLFVVRAIGYILVLFFFPLVLSILTFTVLGSILGENLSLEIQIYFVSITLLLSFLIQPTKKFFDNYSSKLFYRDAYRPEDLINDLNQILISTIDISNLLNRASETIQQYLKSEFAFFALRNSEGDDLRYIIDDDQEVHRSSIEQVRAYLRTNKNKVFLTNVDFEENPDLRQILNNQNIDAVVRITSDPSLEGIGYMFLGAKKSGNLYSSQDIKSLEIIANELVIAIQNALQFEEIQRFNITLQNKVNEATQELRKSNEKLKQLDEAKDEFISMASHQLRTPLTSVKGYVSMVLEGDAGKISKKQSELLGSAFASSQRMVYLIADLLNVSRLKTGKFVIETKPIDLAEVVETEMDQLQESAKSRSLTLNYKKPKDFPTVELDETKIRQVIMNFADNAIYYTPSGGKIDIELKATEKTIEYTVTDNGIGVPKGEQHKLFSKFYRAGNAKKARPDGTGLGLFMAKKVIVAQGGAVIFSSQEGKGSTFGFSFPREDIEVKDDKDSKKSKK